MNASLLLKFLSEVIEEGHSLTTTLNANLSRVKDIRDKAFVQALCYRVIRHYYQLDFILSRLLKKPLKLVKDGDIKALLLLGIYQLQYMRVKAHAAVSETVLAAKHSPGREVFG